MMKKFIIKSSFYIFSVASVAIYSPFDAQAATLNASECNGWFTFEGDLAREGGTYPGYGSSVNIQAEFNIQLTDDNKPAEGSSIKLIQNDKTSGFSGYPTLDLPITGVEFGTNGEIISISFKGEKFDPYWIPKKKQNRQDKGMEGTITFGEQDENPDISFAYESKIRDDGTTDFTYKINSINPIDFTNEAPKISEGNNTKKLREAKEAFSKDPESIPEPSTNLGLLTVGIFGFVGTVSKLKRKKNHSISLN